MKSKTYIVLVFSRSWENKNPGPFLLPRNENEGSQQRWLEVWFKDAIQVQPAFQFRLVHTEQRWDATSILFPGTFFSIFVRPIRCKTICMICSVYVISIWCNNNYVVDFVFSAHTCYSCFGRILIIFVGIFKCYIKC